MTKEENHKLGNLVQALCGYLELDRIDKAKEVCHEIVTYLIEVKKGVLEEVYKMPDEAESDES